MTEGKDRIFVEYTVVAVIIWYCIYYGDDTIGCRFTLCDNKKQLTTMFLYLFVDPLTWFALALADLKVTMVLHIIDEFRF